MSSAATHIAAWQAAGLIDAGTAERLLATETDEPEPVGLTATMPDAEPPPSSASAFFGPGVSIAEAFAYIGGAFLLSGWVTLIAAAAPIGGREGFFAILSAISVVAAGVIGYRLSMGPARFARAAGVVFLVGDAFAAATVVAGVGALGFTDDAVTVAVLGGAGYLAAAIVFRFVHPSVLTTVGLLIGVTTTAGALYAWLGDRLFPSSLADGRSVSTDAGIKVVLTMAWWWATAIIVGVIGLVEAGRRTVDADRRAGMLRFWAGIVAVTGTFVAVSQNDGAERFVPTIAGDLVILGVSAVLLGLAFRREAPAYVIAAAYGIILALTDVNAAYVASEGTGAAFPLLLEGAILVGVGVAADRLRRRIGAGHGNAPDHPESWAPATTVRP